MDRPLPLVLVANKTDLYEAGEETQVQQQQGIEYAKELTEWAKFEVPFIETSAKTGFNVDEMFGKLIKNMNYAIELSQQQ